MYPLPVLEVGDQEDRSLVVVVTLIEPPLKWRIRLGKLLEP